MRFSLEVDMAIGGLGCRPDVIGWRRDRFPWAPFARPSRRRRRRARRDLRGALRLHGQRRHWLQARGLPPRGRHHYWLAGPERRSLTVLRRVEEGYVIAAVATPRSGGSRSSAGRRSAPLCSRSRYDTSRRRSRGFLTISADSMSTAEDDESPRSGKRSTPMRLPRPVSRLTPMRVAPALPARSNAIALARRKVIRPAAIRPRERQRRRC